MGGLLFEKRNTFFVSMCSKGCIPFLGNFFFVAPVSAPPCPVSAFLEISLLHVCSGFDFPLHALKVAFFFWTLAWRRFCTVAFLFFGIFSKNQKKAVFWPFLAIFSYFLKIFFCSFFCPITHFLPNYSFFAPFCSFFAPF